TLEVLKVSPIPADIITLGAEGLRNIWHDAKLNKIFYFERRQQNG
ncbi:hypothetical protein SAMN05421730_10321, partial [Anaerobium acetethylicum]